MSPITVACRPSDPRARIPHSLPRGQPRYLRVTDPDTAKLASPLARFLVGNCPPSVAGAWHAGLRERRVTCYCRETVADLMRQAALPDAEGRCVANGLLYTGPGAAQKAAVAAEARIAACALEAQPAMVEDWLFEAIEPDQSDEDYWARQAEIMLAVGVSRVEIGAAVFQASPASPSAERPS